MYLPIPSQAPGLCLACTWLWAAFGFARIGVLARAPATFFAKSCSAIQTVGEGCWSGLKATISDPPGMISSPFWLKAHFLRCGGLLSALPPDLAAKHLEAKTRQWALHCQGFNAKNSYDRATPCDQDTLRKALKDVTATAWLEWFNGSVQQVFGAYGFFDPEGIFVGDGSCLFVPDNPAYEGSVVM